MKNNIAETPMVRLESSETNAKFKIVLVGLAKAAISQFAETQSKGECDYDSCMILFQIRDIFPRNGHIPIDELVGRLSAEATGWNAEPYWIKHSHRKSPIIKISLGGNPS